MHPLLSEPRTPVARRQQMPDRHLHSYKCQAGNVTWTDYKKFRVEHNVTN